MEIKIGSVAILVRDEIDFNTKTVPKKTKEEHYIMIKGSSLEENITITNTYAHNLGTAKHTG